MKRFFFPLYATFSIALGLTAQTNLSESSIQIPRYETRTLDNGLTVVLMEYHRLPIVEMVLTVGGGRSIEPDSLSGLAGMTAELLRQGTTTRSATQIAEQVDFIGGTLNTGAGLDQFTVGGEFLVKDLSAGLEIFTDIILHPSFPQEEIDRERSQRLASLESLKEDPGSIAAIAYARRVYDAHPYGRQAVGTHVSLPKITRDAVLALYRQAFVPNNALLVLVGDFKSDEMVEMARSSFGPWSRGPMPTLPSQQPVLQKGRHVIVVNKPDVTQTQIRLGNTGVDIKNPDRYAIQIANTILGGGFTSRLVEEIRVKRSLTYGASSSFNSALLGGTFTISTFTKNASLRTTIDVVLEEVKKLREHGVTIQELEKSKNYIAGSFARNLQAPENLASQLSTAIFYKLPPDYLPRYVDQIRSVSLDDIKRVIPKYFQYDNLVILVVTNPAETRQQLEGLGETEEWSLDKAVD